MKEELNDLYDYIPLKIYQNKDYFKFSLDSVLLAEFVRKPDKCKSILELCAGNCAVSMILTTKTNSKITSVELQDEIYNLGLKSITYNNLENQINYIKSDIKNVKNYFPGNNFDVIVCNPPYFTKVEKSYINDDQVKAIARHELNITLEEIIKLSSSMLGINGELYLVHRAERLDEIIILCNKYNVNVKSLQLVTTKVDKEPRLVLVRCIKGSRKNIKINPIICIENMVSFKNIFWKE